MKLRDLELSKRDIKSIAKKVLQKPEEKIGNNVNSTGTKIVVKGRDIDARIGSDLEITIYFDRSPMNDPMSVRWYWGHRCNIDIIGLDDNKQRLDTKHLEELVVSGIEEYISGRSNTPYGMIDVDDFSGDY